MTSIVWWNHSSFERRANI